MTLPAKFAERVLRDLGDSEGAALCAALDTEPPVSVRLNPAKCGGTENGGAGREEDADKAAGRSDGVPPAVLADADGRVPWCGDGYYLAARPQFTFDSDFHAGAYYVQEAASQFVGHLLQGVEVAGRRILDLCAAPGGKTTLYASLAGPDGLVVANEIDRRRAQVLADNVRKWGTGNVAVTTCEARQLGGFEAWFDVVAVDAPCSGEGMFRKNEEACEQWSTQNVELCADRQDEILDCAASMLAGGGRLVYSTCTFAPAEDEGSIGRFLKRHPEFYVEEVPLAEGMSHGLGELSATIRLWPHKLRGEGHYVAVLRKEGTLADGGSGLLKNGYENGITAGDSKSAAAGIPEYLAFAGETFVGDALEKYAGRECRYLKFGEQLYRIPEGMPSVKGLKVLRPGLHLGTAKKGRFEPSHALALTLHAADVLHTMDLPSDGREIRGYLNGETFPAQGEKGWYLITVDGYSTGWGKLAGGIMKNHYPKGLRKRLY